MGTLIRHRGAVLNAVLIVLTLSLLAWVGFNSSARSTPAAASPSVSVPPSESEMRIALSRLSLDVDALAAAGLSGPEATALVGRLRDHLTEHGSQLRSVDNEHSRAGTAADALARRVTAGQSSPEDRQLLETETAARDSAAADLMTRLNNAFAAAVAGLSAGRVATLTSIRNNRQWEMPIEYLTLSNNQAGWVALRDAWTNVRVSAKLDEEPKPSCQQLLLEADASAPVAAARTSLGAGAQAVREAVDNALLAE